MTADIASPTLTAEPTAISHLETMARLLNDMASAMNEQEAFHNDQHVEFGVLDIKQAAAMARKRATSDRTCGPNLRRAMEQTVLTELTRAALTAGRVIKAAGAETWPDLAVATNEALQEIRILIRRNPRLISPALALVAEEKEDSLTSETHEAWTLLSEDHYVLEVEGVVLSVQAFYLPGDPKRWMARFGNVGISLADSRVEAFRAATDAQAYLMQNDLDPALDTETLRP